MVGATIKRGELRLNGLSCDKANDTIRKERGRCAFDYLYGHRFIFLLFFLLLYAFSDLMVFLFFFFFFILSFHRVVRFGRGCVGFEDSDKDVMGADIDSVLNVFVDSPHSGPGQPQNKGF